MGAKKNGGYQLIDMCGIAAGNDTTGRIAKESFFLLSNAIKTGKPIFLTNFKVRVRTDPIIDVDASATTGTFIQDGENSIVGRFSDYIAQITTNIEATHTTVWIRSIE